MLSCAPSTVAGLFSCLSPSSTVSPTYGQYKPLFFFPESVPSVDVQVWGVRTEVDVHPLTLSSLREGRCGRVGPPSVRVRHVEPVFVSAFS